MTVRDFLRAESPYLNGPGNVPKERYLGGRWHELQKEHLWTSRVRQFACREERHDEKALPELRVRTWAGFVFINPDPDAQPLGGSSGRRSSATSNAGKSNRESNAPRTRTYVG